MMKRLGYFAIAGCLMACGGSSSGGSGGAGGSGGSVTTGGSSAFTPGDNEPPASQGAFLVMLKSVSPAPAGKSCPAGSATSFAVPQVDAPNEALSSFTYQHWVIDGDAGAKVSCQVSASGAISFHATLQQAGRVLQIEGGSLGTDHHGTAQITVNDSELLSSPLSSGMDCVVSAQRGDGNFQVQPGSMWASFSCASLEAPPSDYCAATGIFVLENCAK